MKDILIEFKRYSEEMKHVPERIESLESDFSKVRAGLTEWNKKINTLDGGERVYAESVYNKFMERFSDYEKKFKRVKDGHNIVKTMTPQAIPIINALQGQGGFVGLSSGIIPVLTVTSVSAAIVTGLFYLCQVLDPAYKSMQTQIELLDKYLAKQISFTEYRNQSNVALETSYSTKNEFERSTGINLPFVVISAAVIFAGYKLIKSNLLKG